MSFETGLGTAEEVAAYLRTTRSALAQMRYRGNGPVFHRVNRCNIVYRWADVEGWLATRAFDRTDRLAGEAHASR